MNQDVNGNRKLFWKEVSRIKDRSGKFARGENKVQRIWKYYFEELYNINTQEQVAVHMCGFDL